MKPQQGDLLPDKNADRRRLSHEASRAVHLAFALIKYVPLAVKSCRLHFFRVGSTEEFASEAGTPLQIIITHLIAHVAHHRCSIQTAILRYNSVFLRTFCVPFSHSNIFTLGTSLPNRLTNHACASVELGPTPVLFPTVPLYPGSDLHESCCTRFH